MTSTRPISDLTSFVAEFMRQHKVAPEFIVLLPDNSVRTAAWGLGTILVGPWATTLRPENWPTHFMPLPTSSELLDDQR